MRALFQVILQLVMACIIDRELAKPTEETKTAYVDSSDTDFRFRRYRVNGR